MSNLLVLKSSLSGEASVSNVVLDGLVRLIEQRNPELDVVSRDLAAEPIPHLVPATVAGVRSQAKTAPELKARALSDELIDELKAADVIVIGAPMYNFSIPSTLRTWFDHVLRPGVTFSYSAEGPKGLITGKRVIVVESRGGLYSEGPAAALDFQEPYLRQLLAFMGLTDVSFVRAEKIGYGTEARAASIAAAIAGLPLLAMPTAEPVAA